MDFFSKNNFKLRLNVKTFEAQEKEPFIEEITDSRETVQDFLNRLKKTHPDLANYSVLADKNLEPIALGAIISKTLKNDQIVILLQTTSQKRYSRQTAYTNSFNHSAYEEDIKLWQSQTINEKSTDNSNNNSSSSYSINNLKKWDHIQLFTEFCAAIVKNDLGSVNKMMDEYQILRSCIIIDETGWTGLHYALDLGQWDICFSLISKGSELNILDAEGNSPLILLLKWKSQSGLKLQKTREDESSNKLIPTLQLWRLLKLMVEKEANINSQNNKGKTALMYAAKQGVYDVVKFLIDNGADASATTVDGRTCLYFAEKSRSSKVNSFLLSWIENYPIGQSVIRKMSKEENDLKKLYYNSGWGTFNHLLLIVPGIGEQGEDFWKKQVPKILKSRDDSYSMLSNKELRLEIRIVDWANEVCQLIDDKLSKIVPSGLDPMRVFMTHTLFDVMAYNNGYYSSQLFKELCDNLNRTYDKFREEYPGFAGSCSILSHSIATTTCWDLLSFQSIRPKSKNGNIEAWKANSSWKETELHKSENLQLKFTVENFFLVGSYTSVFLSFKGDAPATQRFPQCNNIYNLYYLNDPLAYRLEPWIHEKFSNLDPVPIKYPNRKRSVIKELFNGKRYDFVLRLNSKTNWASYSAKSHYNYWGSKDLMLFVMEQCSYTD